jgi:hypothetical protein
VGTRVNEPSDTGGTPTWPYVVAGLAVGALLTLAVVVVVLVVVGGGDGGSGRAGDVARPPAALDPAEARQLLEEALAATLGDDAAWAAETETAVLDAFEGPVLGDAESVEVTCGSELCRVTAVLGGVVAGDPAVEGFLITLNQALSPVLPRSVAETEAVATDRVRFTVYMARTGYYLPTEGGGPID